jgi:hypothetical protein
VDTVNRNEAHPDAGVSHPAASPRGCLPGDAGAVPGVGLDGSPGSTSPGTAPHLQPVVVDGDPEPLFGLEDDDPPRKRPPLETAVRRTLQALDREGALTDSDAGRVALAIELSQIIADKRATRRTSTVGHDARVLMDILDELAPAAASESDKQLRRAMDDWSAMLAAQDEARRGRPEVRDPA